MTKMKILLCHNYYQQPGGEDQAFSDEAWLLESRGHEVVRYTRHNNDIDQMNRWDLSKRTFWNHEAYTAKINYEILMKAYEHVPGRELPKRVLA